MAPEYASKQPAGYKNYIENIAIIGAGGQIGKFITEAILANGKSQNITAITREGSKNAIPTGVTAKPVNYDDEASLVAALKGQDVLIITLSVYAPPDTSKKLISAAAKAGVPWVLPNEYGVNSGHNEQAGIDTMIGQANKANRDFIEELGVSSWIGIACGFWYEFSLGGYSIRYGFDFKERSVVFYDQGEQKINTSTWPQTGRAVGKLLALKILPEDEGDKSPTLDGFRNQFLKVSSFEVNQRDMFASVLRVTGTKEQDWKISYQPVKERFDEGKAMLAKGDRTGFGQLLYARAFFPDGAGNFGVSGLDNEKLGLPVEDLDEYTKVGIHLAENGYFEGLY